jgi:hypothetical protein
MLSFCVAFFFVGVIHRNKEQCTGLFLALLTDTDIDLSGSDGISNIVASLQTRRALSVQHAIRGRVGES